jgi:DNA-binding LacI/PurR family transcriptional regulator
MGTRAAALALELAESDPGGKREVWLQTELVVRRSTAAPKESL